MPYLPHEKLAVNWNNNGTQFNIVLPWLSMEIDVLDDEKPWIENAIENLHSVPLNDNTQRFIQNLKDYPIFYYKPRTLADFKRQDLQESIVFDEVNLSTPLSFFQSVKISTDQSLIKDIPKQWSWDWDKILNKARIGETDLYDPLSFISYLICYRLEWESTSWSGQDGLGQLLEKFLKEDEEKFFRAIGWISRQSLYVTMECCEGMRPALEHFPKAKDLIHHFIMDEAGHYKFMEQVFADINLNKDDFEVGPATKWLLAAHRKMATVSPLAFSAMINIFEAAFYEGQDPISRVIKQSSKPEAAHGYDLHYKINQEHRHCDMPLVLAQRLAPQNKQHLLLTLAIFELTLYFLDQMEKRLDSLIKI